MKKTLIAVAALSAMAASAMAANVTLSGTVDLGLNYLHSDKAGTKANSFTMGTSQNSGSKFMLKGSEDLGNGVEVGFQLENQFNADDGSLKSNAGKYGRLFHRESRLYVKTNFGTLHFGRFGALDAGTGSVSIFGGSNMAAFGTGWASYIGAEGKILKGISARYDNSVAYESPKFAGFSVHLDHSFKADDTGTEGRPSANQYNAAGLKYVNGAFNAAFVFSQQNYASAGTAGDNGRAYSLGVGYDFGACKLLAQAQYFDQGETLADDDGLCGEKGWGATLGLTAPVGGGKILAFAGYKDAELASDSATDKKAWNISVGYEYGFSKRTKLYVGAGYHEDKTEKTTTVKNKYTEVVTGLVHTF